VALGVDHAQKTERLIRRGAELMPGPGRHGDEIERADFYHLVADQRPAAPAQDRHRMRVLMALQRRPAAGGDLEITQLPLQIRRRGQNLPRHAAEGRARLVLVGAYIDALPAVIRLRFAQDRFVHRFPSDGLTAAAKAAVSATSCSGGAESSAPPISSIVSSP